MNTLAFQIGAWVGGPGETPQPTAENVQAFQDLQGSHLDLINHFALFDINDWDNVKQYADVVKANGSTLMITWMPNGYGAQDIVDGKTDNYIREFSKGVKEFGDEIWLRPLHEANGDWYDWGKSQDWSNWQTFTQVFKKSYEALSTINKPLFIAEISCSEKGGNKAEWIADMFEQFQTNFSRVFAVMWFSQSKDYEGDWALNTSQAAVDAWKAGIAK